MNLTGSLIKKVVSLHMLQGKGINLSATNAIGAADTYFPVTYKTEQLKTVFEITAFVWIVGAVGALLAVTILYYLTSRELRNTFLVKDNIYSSEMVQAPIVQGIFRQRIIIPEDYIDKEEQMKYVLLHEIVHLRRHDNLLRLMAALTACIHWFNPFIWIFMKLFIDDMELTCDIKAVKTLSMEARKQYARTLINVSSRQHIFMSAAFGKANVKVRVMNVLTYKKLSILALAATMIFVIVVSAILLTNPVR
jgi:beta-lactamase regulating signal transducer with metallopeptidase domain